MDENWAAKISDFGLSKIGPANQDCTDVSTHVKGTFGYLDPEYYLTRRVTRKSDVYALGVVLFEVLCGRPALDLKLDEEQHSLARWAKKCIKEGKLDQIIDLSLRGQILTTCLTEFTQVANQCLHNQPKKRPTMAEVVFRLEFALSLQEMTDISIGYEQIPDGAYDKQENVDSLTEHVVINARDCSEHQEKRRDGNTRLGAASGTRSQLVSTQKVTFIRKVQSLFTVKTPLFAESIQRDEVVDGDRISESLQFSFATVSLATNNFSVANRLGPNEGNPLYKGRLQNGQEIVVKRFALNEFWHDKKQLQTVVLLRAKLRHGNLVKFLGFCVEGMESLLIYEFVPNASVENWIFDKARNGHLDWDKRYKIIAGVAQGLLYLHEDSPLPIIHRDLKASNILLDEQINPKISDSELAMSLWPDRIQIHDTLVLRTMRNVAPECIRGKSFTMKSDVYSFGVLLLEIISGLRNEDSTGRSLLRDASLEKLV